MFAYINGWLRKVGSDSILNKRPLAVCEDGFVLSIQAGSNYMCDLCIDRLPGSNAIPAYKTVEVFVKPDNLTAEDELITGSYGTGDGIFGFVPVSVLRDLIISHGGLIMPDEHGFMRNLTASRPVDNPCAVSIIADAKPNRFYINAKTGERTKSKDVAKVWLYLEEVPVKIHTSRGCLVTLNPLGI